MSYESVNKHLKLKRYGVFAKKNCHFYHEEYKVFIFMQEDRDTNLTRVVSSLALSAKL